MYKIYFQVEGGTTNYKLKYNKNKTLAKHWGDWFGDLIPEFFSMFGDRRGRASFDQENVATVSTGNCAQWSNGNLRSKGYTISGDAWGLNNVALIASGYTNLALPNTDSLDDMNIYNWDAADRLAKNFNLNSLNKNQRYVVNMYSTGSPYLRESFYNGRTGHGSHTGLLRYENGNWYVYHNWHGTVKKTLAKNVWGSNNEIGITAIYKPLK